MLGATKPFEIYDRIYLDSKTGKPINKNKEGGLAKAQTGLLKGFKTYQSDPEYFNSRAVLHDDPRYNEQVKELIFSGKAAYNPATGELRFMNSTPAPADVRQMSTREYTEGVRRDPTDPRFAGADDRTKQIIQESTRQAYENPLMYAPGTIGMAMLPVGFGMGYGMTQAATQAGEGNYGNAALTAGLSMLPVAGRITNNHVIPTVLQSSLAKKVVAPQTLENLVGKNISLSNAAQYDPVLISTGAFGEASYLKKFPNIIIKKSPSDRVFSVMGDAHLTNRFEDIPQKPGQLYPKYYKSQSRATFNNDNYPYEFEVMSRVPGKPVGELSTKQLSSIPKESWNSLLDELQFLREKDVGFDMVGANLLYDPKTAKFGMIDLSPGASKTKSAWQTHVLGNVSPSDTPQEAREKFKEALVGKLDDIFSRKDKQIKWRIAQNKSKNLLQAIKNFQLMENSMQNKSMPNNLTVDYTPVRDILNDRRYSLLNQLTGLKVGGLAKAQPGGKKNSLYNTLLDYKESPDEDKVEFFDLSGLTSWDDAVKGYDSWTTSNRTYPTIPEGMDMFSAVPLFGRAKKVYEGMKYVYKPWRPAINKLYGLADYIRETYDKSKEEKQTPEKRQGGKVHKVKIKKNK